MISFFTFKIKLKKPKNVKVFQRFYSERKDQELLYVIDNTPLGKVVTEQNNKIFNLIENAALLECFRESLPKYTVKEILEKTSKKYKIVFQDFKDMETLSHIKFENYNCYLTDNGEFYLPQPMWDEWYVGFQKLNFELVLEDKNSKEYYLQRFLQYSLKKIQSTPILKTQKAFECIKFLLENNCNLLEVTKMTLQHQIQYFFRQKNIATNKYDIEIPLNTLMLNLGDNIIEYIVLHHPIVQEYVKLKKGYNFNKAKLLQQTEMRKAFFKAALKNEKEKLKDILGNQYNNNLLLELIKNYMLALVFHPLEIAYEKTKDLEDLEKGEKEFIMNLMGEMQIPISDIPYYTENYKNICVGLASILLDPLEQHSPIGEPILTSFLKTTLKKHRWLYKVNPHVVQMLMESCSINKPYLTEQNITFIKEKGNKETDTVLDILYNKKNKFIHSNDFIKLEIQKESYLNDHKPLLYLTINREVLFTLLNSIKNVENVENFEEFKNLENLSSALYDITYPTEDSDLKNKIIVYSLVFQHLNLFQDDALTKLKKREQVIFKDIINKVTSHKIIIKNILKDLIMYLPYKYFLLETFLDSRGRMYLNSDFLNIQIYPLVKGFVNYYSGKDVKTKKEFHELKESVRKYLSDSELKKKLTHLGYDAYQVQEKELKLSFIKSFFNNDFNINLLLDLNLNFITNSSENLENQLLNTIVKNIKKKNRTFYVLNLITAYNKTYNLKNHLDINIANSFYELDATCSGLQMFSMIFDNLDFGIQSNLIGKDKVDIYKVFINSFDQHLTKLTLAVEFLLTNYFKEYIFDTSKKVIPINLDEYNLIKDNKTLILEGFALMDINKSYCAVDILLDVLKIISEANLNITKIKDILEEKLQEVNTSLNDFTWILTSDEKLVLNYKAIPLKKQELKNFMLIRSALKFYFLKTRIDKTPHTLYQDRSYFKDAIMTFFYGSTNFSRKNVIIQLIAKADKNINYRDAIILATYSDAFFLFYINKILKDNKIIFKLRDSLMKLGQPIKIQNQNLSMIYAAVKYKKIIKELPSFQKDAKNTKMRNKQITYIQKTDEFDQKEFAKGFIPNFIHYIDAAIVHKFYDLITKINEDLKKNKSHLPKINCTTNHDTFNCNMTPFLRYFIEDCYLSLYRDKPIKWLLDNLPKETQDYAKSLLNGNYKKLDLKTLNPNFIK